MPDTPPPSTGLAGRLVAGLLTALLLVGAFMFSLVALAVAAIGGLALWGWLWWKTRALRRAMAEATPVPDDVIEGVCVRTDETPDGPDRLLK
jgi:hypothetical protein